MFDHLFGQYFLATWTVTGVIFLSGTELFFAALDWLMKISRHP